MTDYEYLYNDMREQRDRLFHDNQTLEARAYALTAEVDTLRAQLDAAPIQFIDGRAYRLIPVDGVTAGIWPPAPPQE